MASSFRKTSFSNKMKVLCLLLVVSLVSGERIVNTNSGPVRGTSVAGRKVEAFLGVPYAEPPVGVLRFARPVPKSPWDKPYDADKLPLSCVQATFTEIPENADFDTQMSEDCLFLNLWVPEAGSDLKPIIAFIHGGAYMAGTSNIKGFDGAKLSERGDVIVATINYRVGTLGFFSAFIDEAAGNMGMYDQVMAIRWIKDNAKHFGGDPDNIVLMGESAGAFSVSLHMVSPLSKNLFKRSILLSGSAYHPMYSGDNKKTSMGSQTIASMLGCATDDESLKRNPKEVVNCMKHLPIETFPKNDFHYFKKHGMLIPRVGDDFLPTNPIDLYKKGNFKKNEVLMGVTRDEGTLLLAGFKSDIFGFLGEKVDYNSFNESSAEEILYSLTQVDDNCGIFRSYFDRVKVSSRYTYLDAMSDAFGDYLITCGAVFQAEYQSQKNIPVYFYLFDFRPSTMLLPEWIGVPHFSEVQYVFGNRMFKDFVEFEEELSKDMMDMWTAFAKTGNPNVPGGVKWPRYTPEDSQYYIIGKRDAIGVRPDKHRCDKWRNFFRSAVRKGEKLRDEL